MSQGTQERLAERRLYTPAEAAAFFGMSRRWVELQMAARELDVYQLGRPRISGPSMNRLLERRRVQEVAR